MNRLMVTGHVVGDPVSGISDDGEVLATFTLADGQSRSPERAGCAHFHCTARGRMAVAVDEYLSAGSSVVVNGQLIPAGHTETLAQLSGKRVDFGHYDAFVQMAAALAG